MDEIKFKFKILIPQTSKMFFFLNYWERSDGSEATVAKRPSRSDSFSDVVLEFLGIGAASTSNGFLASPRKTGPCCTLTRSSTALEHEG